MPSKKNNKSGYLKFYSEIGNRPGFLIRRLHQIHVAMFLDECSDSYITPVQFSTLSALVAKSKLDQGSLGALVGIDRTNIADVVARLEKRGWVRRVVNPLDRRMKLVSITTKGKKFVQNHMEGMMRAQERFIDPLSIRERELLMKLLKKMVVKNNEKGRTTLSTNFSPKVR